MIARDVKKNFPCPCCHEPMQRERSPYNTMAMWVCHPCRKLNKVGATIHINRYVAGPNGI